MHCTAQQTRDSVIFQINQVNDVDNTQRETGVNGGPAAHFCPVTVTPYSCCINLPAASAKSHTPGSCPPRHWNQTPDKGDTAFLFAKFLFHQL